MKAVLLGIGYTRQTIRRGRKPGNRFVVNIRMQDGRVVGLFDWDETRLEWRAWEEAQVDFGTGAWIRWSDGKRRRSWIFRIVLCCSRKAYSEAVLAQDAETFIRCIENAFRCFGGVTQTLVIDNLRAAVSKADWYEPEINPKLESFCRHYGTVILPCRVRKPEHKGKVERGSSSL